MKQPLLLRSCGRSLVWIWLGLLPAHADPILAPGDPIIAFDFDVTDVSASASPTNEGPRWALDGAPETKYANLGGVGSGLIVTPGFAEVVRSFVITTANDFPERDPAAWQLYGTDDAISSPNNSTGIRENWALIGEGAIALPEERFTAGPAVAVSGDTAYASYKLIITALKDDPQPATVMQFSDLQFYTEADGAGTPLLTPEDVVLAVQEPAEAVSSYPGNETPAHAIDGDPGTKYLNFAKQGSGFIITPEAGSTTVRSFLLTTANDAEPRDPSSYELYGTNDSIDSIDNSHGQDEDWILIQEGDLALPAARNTEGELIVVTGAAAYTSYRLSFPTVKNATTANSMQIAEVQFYSDESGVAPIFEAFDDIRAVQVPASQSSYVNTSALNEGPLRVIDGREDTKYLNNAAAYSGFIVTPASGAAVVKSLVLTTANDAPGRDPARWELYGTNEEILSTNNSNGEAEAWTFVAAGDLALPDDRFTPSDPIPVPNDTAYTSWRLVFPTIKDAALPLMQIAEAQFHTSTDGSGAGVLAPLDAIIAVQIPHTESSSPAGEAVTNILDGDSATKYLNRGGINNGFIVTPAYGPSVITGLTVTTANDFPGRDPAAWELYGTNDPIVSLHHGPGDAENWTLITAGDDLQLPDERFAIGDTITFDNTTSYTSYRFVVLSLRDPALPLVQYADVQFEGTAGTVVPPVEGFAITAFTRNATTGGISLTWASEAAATYRIAYSTTLAGWPAGTVEDDIPSGGASTTRAFAVPAAVASEPALFFRVEKK